MATIREAQQVLIDKIARGDIPLDLTKIVAEAIQSLAEVEATQMHIDRSRTVFESRSRPR